MPTTYRPRNDFILFRVTDRGQVNGIAMPNQAAQGKVRTIVAVGPDVRDLNVGDVIEVMGTIGQDVAPLPNERNLFITKQSNVLLVVEQALSDDGPGRGEPD